jgi:hypothetical protein
MSTPQLRALMAKTYKATGGALRVSLFLASDVENLRAEHVLHLEFGEQHLAVVTTPRYASVGDVLHLTFDLIHAHLIDPVSGEMVASALREEPV